MSDAKVYVGKIAGCNVWLDKTLMIHEVKCEEGEKEGGSDQS